MFFSSARGFVLSAAACALVLMLSGCGGGGSSSGSTPPPGRSMAQLDPEPVALPGGVTLATAETFTLEPGASVDRDGARFTCAAGGPACTVVVAERDGGGFAATSTGGEVMVAAVRVPDNPDPEPVALPEGVTLATAGIFAIEPGASVDRDGARFTCAAGGPACIVVVAERDGGGGFVATVAEGEVVVARAPASPGGGGQDGGQNGEMEERDWPFPDWPTTYLNSGGGALSWSPSDIYSRIRTIEDRGSTGYGAAAGSPLAAWCMSTSSDESYCNVEYQPVMTSLHGGIPIVQARALGPGTGVDRRPSEEIGIVGILDHGYFAVALRRAFIGRSYEREYIGAETYIYSPPQSRSVISTGHWRGALVGTGSTATSPLYRQFFIGNVDVTVGLGTVRTGDEVFRNVDVEFSNVRNINTGEAVTLSRTQWRKTNLSGKGSGYTSVDDGLRVDFRGPNDEEVFGAFRLEEAVGAFGAKKQ